MGGCSFGKDTANKMYNHLEKAVNIEQGFIQYQKQLINKEQKEQSLYKKIVHLQTGKLKEVITISKQASQLAADRKQLIMKEKKVIDKAFDEFSKVKPLVGQLKNAASQKKANQMIQAMDQRHKVYRNLYDDYINSIDLDQKLYHMLESKDIKQVNLSTQVSKINGVYKEIEKEKDRFNQLTDQYNNAKKAFYKSAGIKIGNTNS